MRPTQSVRTRKIESYEKASTDSLVREGTRLRILTTYTSSKWLENHGYEPKEPDDCIIGAVQLFIEQNPDSNVLLLTDDTGMRLRARRGGVNVMEPPLERLLDEPDPFQKENQRLRAEKERLENRQPKLVFGLQQENGEIGDEIEFEVDFTAQGITEAEIECALEAKRKELEYIGAVRCPEVSKESWGEYKARVQQIGLGALSPIPPSKEEVDTYTESLEKYLQKEYRSYLERMPRYKFYEARTRQIVLVLENGGTIPAEDIDVWLHFHDGLALTREKIAQPEEPSPPVKPKIKTRFDNMLGVAGHLGMSLGPIMPPPVRSPSLDRLSRPPMTIRKVKSYEVEWSIDTLKHYDTWTWPPLCVTFDTPETSPKVIPIDYRITAANMPDLIEGTLRIRLCSAS